MSQKLYKIGHLTEHFDISSRTIRYYDQLGLLPNVKRSDGGTRIFDDADSEIVRKIRHLPKKECVPVERIKERLFDSPFIAKNTCFFTDKNTIKDFPELNELSSMQVVDISSKKTIQNFILDQYKQGKTCFIPVHNSKSCKERYAELKKELKKQLTIIPILSNHKGNCVPLLVNHIQKQLTSINSIQELILNINHLTHLTSSFAIVSPISPFITINPSHDWITDIKEFTCLINSSLTTINVLECNPSFQQTQTNIIDNVNEYILNKRRCINMIEVSFKKYEKKSTKIKKTLEKTYKNSHVILKENKTNAYLGDAFILISMI